MRSTIPRPAGTPCALLQRRHLLGRHQAGMVVLVAGERQAPALDGVGDEAVRPVVGDAVEGLEHGLEIVPAEIGHQRGERLVVVAVEQRADAGIAAEVALQMRPPGGPALEAQGGVEVVRAGVDPGAQRLAAGPRERRLQLLAVLDRDHPPADRGEELLDLGEQQLAARRGRGSAGCSRSPTRDCGRRASSPRAGPRRCCPRRARRRRRSRPSGRAAGRAGPSPCRRT